MMFLLIVAVLLVVIVGCLYFAFADNSAASKRVAAIRRVSSSEGLADIATAARRKNVENALKGLDKKPSLRTNFLSVRRRLDSAGFASTPTKFYWIASAASAAAVSLICTVYGQSLLVILLANFVCGLGFPLWVLSFLQRRREKKFTGDFANAIDVIVRSVKSGFPVNEALKVVAYEFREPVSGEFRRLVDGMKLGLSLDAGLKRMYDSMPTPEVAFFGIVMGVQQKSGGNLAEALSNLASVLRDRKRLEGKVKAMSSEAKASAMIIGALPPTVMLLVYMTSPDYIMLLFTERMGNVLLAICVFWMGVGIFSMHKMINFKH